MGINLSSKQKGFLIFVFTVSMCIGAMSLAYFLVKETPTQALCDDMMELMTDPMHNIMHEKYIETMYLLHGYIEDCHRNGMYVDTNDYEKYTNPNMTGMTMP